MNNAIEQNLFMSSDLFIEHLLQLQYKNRLGLFLNCIRIRFHKFSLSNQELSH